MRKYPYKLDEMLVNEHLESTKNLLKELKPELSKAKSERNAMFFKIFGESVQECGAYGYLFLEPIPVILKHLREANKYYTWAISFDLVLDPYEYIDILSLSIVLDDVKQAQHLAAFPRARYTTPDVEAGEVVYALAESIGMLVLDSGQLQERLKACKKHLASKKIIPYDKTVSEPLIAMLEALSSGDQNAFDKALEFRQKNFTRLASMPDNRYMPNAFVDIPGLALVRMALARGLVCNETGAHLPLELLQKQA